MFLLDTSFLEQYNDFPDNMNPLSRFVYLRTYSRWINSKKRRETWKETVKRAVEYNINLEVKHLEKIGYKLDSNRYKELKNEAQKLFDNMYHLRQFLSGRTLWIGGADTGVADKYPLGNFNCAFLNINSFEDLGDLFYLLLVGTGVGFKCTLEMAAKLPKIKCRFNLRHEEYRPVEKHMRKDVTSFSIIDLTEARIKVGDSKEGWVKALRIFFTLLTDPLYKDIHTISFNYNFVRPKGERLLTFGGTASGHEPLKEMFEGFAKALRGDLDPDLVPIQIDSDGYGKIRPIHVLDFGNLIGYNVVVGGVRRTAEIFLFDQNDYECLLAKYGINGIWSQEQIDNHVKVAEQLNKYGARPKWFDSLYTIGSGRFNLNHRRMSNNSIAFTETPDKDMLTLIFNIMKFEGEPGFINLAEANRRRPNCEGLNPCAEILLDSYNVCNLTTVNVSAFVKNEKLDWPALKEAQRLSARAGLRMTLVDLELPHWDKVQKRDRLLGTSVTGWKDAISEINYDQDSESYLLEQLRTLAEVEAETYSYQMRIPCPLLITTVKPEGTLSQVAGGVSSGLHYAHAPYFIRRIRINSEDALAKAVMHLGWTVNPEVGTPGETYEEQMKNARTYVIDFPVKSGAKKTREEVSARQQLETYFLFQEKYTNHNSSNTINVRPNEWDEVRDIVYENWNNFVGVSFLAYDGGTYPLAPYEECTEEQYEKLKSSMIPLTLDVLEMFERVETTLDIGNDGCEAGICPIR